MTNSALIEHVKSQKGAGTLELVLADRLEMAINEAEELARENVLLRSKLENPPG